jgi:sulfite exporter TauE/SafE/copper chaperone CopZ
MSHKKITLDIKGMHCRSCEILLEDNIGEVGGVKKVRTNYKKGIAEIEYDEEPDRKAIEHAVAAAGYSLGKEDKKHFFSRNPQDYLELGAVTMILFVIYLVLKTTGVLSFDLKINSNPGLIGVLIVGLTAGVSTCMALIGGLVLGISSRHAERHPEATALEKFRPHLFFNLGRLMSFVILGGVIGLLGSALKLSSSVLGIITVVLGFVMLLLGLKLIDIFPKLHNKGLVLPASVSRFFGISTEVKEYSHKGAFITGALTFFVPCAFTQAMQLYAVSTGSFVGGALIMGMFALGTLPGIIGIGGFTSAIKGGFARYFFRLAGVVVIALAIFNIRNGSVLAGVTIGLPANEKAAQGQTRETGVELVDGKQVVLMTQELNGYRPRVLTVKKGIPVVWKITSTSQFTCAAYINMPAYRISQPLKKGENSIEFTPTKTGKVPFTCSMGMYSGIFNVTD